MSALLSEAIGSSNTALMLLTGEPIDAQRALDWGLISEILSPDQLLPEAERIAAVIAKNAPIAAESAKSNIRAAFSMSREDAIGYERDLQVIALATEDANEGRLAFKEKRQPKFNKR
jgi:enoyl-CoA hydratase